MSREPPRRSSSRGAAAAAEKPLRYKREIQAPNVIARLMGINAIPPPPKPPAAMLQAQPAAAAAAGETNKAISPRSRQSKCSLLSYHRTLKKMRRVPAGRWSRSRHHPKEDLLQKFKHDFQASSRALVHGSSSATQPPLLDGIQMIAQENLRRQKMAGFTSVAHDTLQLQEKKAFAVPEEESHSETAAADRKVVAVAGGDERFQHQETVITVLRATSPCAPAAASEKSRDLEDEHDSSSSASDEEIMLRSTTPRIVLLKAAATSDTLVLPDGGVANGHQKPLFGLPRLMRNGSISRLLEEVKEVMLHKELQQSNDKPTAWATEPKQQIGRPDVAAKQDHRPSKRLFSRSESFRAFRSDRDEATASTKHASPEHVVKVLTGNNILDRKPRNKYDEESTTSCSITSTPSRSGRVVVRSLPADVSPSSGVGLFGDQSFRSECLTMRQHRDNDTSSTVLSPARALFRSLSAPESGFFSLGRLFQFGDATSVTSTCKTHSEGAAALMTSKSRSTTSFSFIRGSLTRHLFRRRKTHHKTASLGVGEIHPQMAIGPTPPPSPPETFNLFKVAQANLTELPPSPVSPLEVMGHSCRHFLSDFNCTIPELSPKCLSEFGAQNASELPYSRTDLTVQTACSHDKAYIREVLVAAGLYGNDDGSLDNNKVANGRVDSMARPISNDIFEEVQDMYYYRGNDAIGTDHRMLFDLANEALQSLVMQGASSLRQWVIDSIGVSRGKRLLDDVWHQVQTLRNPEMQEMQTIDSMVAYEIRKYVWDEVLYQDVYVVGRKIERVIFDQLIEDLLVEGFHLIL